MPKAGGKKFPYDEEGKKAAKAYAREKGLKVEKYFNGGAITDARQRGQMQQMSRTADPFSNRNPNPVVANSDDMNPMIPPPNPSLVTEGAKPQMGPISNPNPYGMNPPGGAKAPEEGETAPTMAGAPPESGTPPPQELGGEKKGEMEDGGMVTSVSDARLRSQKYEVGGKV